MYIWKNVFQESNKFFNFVSRKDFNINYHLDKSPSKFLIYLLSRSVYNKLYVRSTVIRFRFHLNKYKRCQRKVKKVEGHAQRYFHKNYFTEDCNNLTTYFFYISRFIYIYIQQYHEKKLRFFGIINFAVTNFFFK